MRITTLALLLGCGGSTATVPEPVTPVAVTPPDAPVSSVDDASCALALEGPADVRVSVADSHFSVMLTTGARLEAMPSETSSEELDVVHDGALRFHGRRRLWDVGLTLPEGQALAPGIVLPHGVRISRLRATEGDRADVWVRLGTGMVGLDGRSYPIGVEVGSMRCGDLVQGESTAGDRIERVEGGELAFVDGALELAQGPGGAPIVTITPTRDSFPLFVVERRDSQARVALAYGGGVRLDGWAAANRLRSPSPTEQRSLRFGSGGLLGMLGAGGRASSAPAGAYRGPASLRVGAEVRLEPDGSVWATVGRRERFLVYVPTEDAEWVAIVEAEGIVSESLATPPASGILSVFVGGIPQGTQPATWVHRAWVRRGDVELPDAL